MGRSTAQSALQASAVPVPRSAAPVADLPLELAGDVLALADADADAFADTLHDGVLQALVVARYAADSVVRGGDPLLARDAVQEALVALRRAVWLSRPRGDAGLVTALRDLAAHRASGDEPVLRLELDELACAALSPTAASVAHRVVQHAGAVPLTVRVTRGPGPVVQVALDAPLPDPAADAVRARAAGGCLSASADSTVLTLPLPQALAPSLRALEDPS